MSNILLELMKNVENLDNKKTVLDFTKKEDLEKLEKAIESLRNN